MDNIRKILSNSTMAHTNMDININTKKIITDIFNLLEENKENIIKANEIDIKNNNGFQINVDMISKLKKSLFQSEDSYRKVISMYKTENNYLEGKQTDNLGTLCLVYDGNTYSLLELALKSILTHNSIIFASESEYMKGTNELIAILIKRILQAYNIDSNLIQILYTSHFEELLSNSVSINKVIAIGNRDFQEKIKKISKIEVISKGYNYFDIYIEDVTHLSLVEKIVESHDNIDLYVKSGIEVPFEDYIEVQDLDEAIAQINFNTSGYSTSIFTDNGQNASEFLRQVKSENISVNSSPLFDGLVNINLNLLLIEKNMFYPNPLAEGNEKNKFEMPTRKAILNKLNDDENNEKINKMQKENKELKDKNEKIQANATKQLAEKEQELNDLKKQLNESQKIANKYIGIFQKSFFTRLFGNLRKKDIEKDTKLLH